MVKKMTTEDLARMMKRGFDQTASKQDLKAFRKGAGARYEVVDKRFAKIEAKLNKIDSKIVRKSKSGFTLIELMVVISIISLLASIVLASLSSARTKARSTKVLTDLSQIRNLAGLISSDDNSYSGLCVVVGGLNVLNTSHAKYGTQITAFDTDINYNNGTNGVAVCHASATDYCVSAVDANNNTKCISNKGNIGTATCSAPGTSC